MGLSRKEGPRRGSLAMRVSHGQQLPPQDMPHAKMLGRLLFKSVGFEKMNEERWGSGQRVAF